MKSHLLLALWLILNSALHCDGSICPQQKQSHDFADCGMVPAQVATLMPSAHLCIFSWTKKRNQIVFIYLIMVESNLARHRLEQILQGRYPYDM